MCVQTLESNDSVQYYKNRSIGCRILYIFKPIKDQKSSAQQCKSSSKNWKQEEQLPPNRGLADTDKGRELVGNVIGKRSSPFHGSD